MKKALLTFLTLLMIASLVFVGCNEPPISDENSGSGTTQQPSGGNPENPNGGNSGGGNQEKPEDENETQTPNAKVVDVLLSKASDYSDESPKLVAKAKYDNSSEKDVTSEATWTSSDVSVATVSAGEISILSTGTTVITATYSNVESGKATITVTENVSSGEIDKLYFITTTQWSEASPRYAAYFFGAGEKWIDMTEHSSGVYVCDKISGYPSVIFCRMDPSKSENNWDNKWDQTADLTIPSDKDTYKYGENQWSKGTGDWLSDLTGNYSSDTDSTYSVKVSIKNTNNSGSSEPVVVAPDTFTWDNALVYFVLTDRFYNGDTDNDYSYYRTNKSKGFSGPDVATFHGGDIVGLTEKLDYLDDLGVNAIWITAPYEQIHGWCSGKNGAFPHFAFHGYYTQDWTFMDQNMGTIEEFRTFVNEAHKRGIRIVMDVVMNHTGYNTIEDMITYNFGNLKQTPSHGWLSSTSNWSENHNITNYSEQGNWGNWWGKWVRAFSDQPWYTNAGYLPNGNNDLTAPLSGLPDVVTESTTKVAIPTFLKTKWNAELNKNTTVASGNTTGNSYKDYQLPSISDVDWYGKSGDWREDNKGAPADYLVMWLSAWVREFGIDGFRCDTAKHVDKYRWGQLKEACQSALEEWRNDSSKVDTAGAKDWDENFWMTGEHFGFTSKDGNDEYYKTGKFDSMINFSFNGGQWNGSGTSGSTPSESTWSDYISINSNSDSDNNGNKNNVLSYISSHDTGLHRPGNQIEVGTKLVLLPGGVQIYYGDESSRPAVDAYGDTDMATRGDMNFGANADSVTHWGKVGTFRKYNPAVGAGTGTAYKRTYNGTNAGGQNKVAIGVSGSSVDVSGLFSDGTTVYNWYDGSESTVSGGKVTFAGGSMKQPILVSDRNPSDYDITF